VKVSRNGSGSRRSSTRRSLRNAAPRTPGGLRSNGTIRPPRAQVLGHEKETMAYVIAEPCIDTKDNSCVEVCPVDCIHPTPDEPDYDNVNMLYIDPEECIDCDACVEACPVDACFAEDQLPDEWQNYIQINADYYKQAG
jgi:ferredoxin